MAKSKSRLLAKLKKKSKGAWKRSRETEARAKGSMLPDGIVRGVAKLSSYKFDEDKNGNPYFMITGIVVEPSEYAGQRATTSHFIKETQTKTVEDKLDGLSSDIQLLGGDVSGAEIDDLPDLLEGLCKDGPHYFFNTWKPDNGQTMVFIQGLADDWEPEEDEEDADDEDADDSDEDEEEDDAEEDEGEDEDPEDEDAEEEDEDEPDPEDEDEGDEEDPDDEDEGDEEEEDDWEPEKGDVYLYATSSRSKPKECEVISVNKRAGTVNLKRASDGKTLNKVAWDKLQDVE